MPAYKRIVAAMLLIALLASAAFAQAVSPAQAGRQQTLMVAMRDGVHLSTDVYLPRGRGPWPVILVRTPYDKSPGPYRGLSWRGYAVVAQDMRGRFASEGKAIPFLTCGQDGADTMAWLLEQPWCNGKVGTLGASALGITQNLLAAEHPPGLVCQHITVGGSSLYHDALYQAGALRQSLIIRWLEDNRFDPESAPLFRSHPVYDDLWRRMDAAARASEITAPALHIGGWFDIFCQGTINGFVSRQTRGGKGARGNQWLIMGPWTHGIGRAQAGQLAFPENAGQMPPHAAPQMWFDYWLKGRDNGLRAVPHVTYYVMGACGEPNAPGNEWRTAEAWPIPASDTPYYLGRDGTLSLRKPTRDAEPLTYIYDPENPMPTLGGANLNIPAGPMDQRPVEGRADVLVFSTPALEQPVEVTGQVRVRLYASSDAPDTDFAAKLCDVYPDGRSMLICDGIVRARYREPGKSEAFLVPGKVVAFDLDLWSTSLIFNRGHRLRLTVSSSNAPRFEPNPNAGPGGKPRKATQAVFCDRRYPSALWLPLPKRQASRRSSDQ